MTLSGDWHLLNLLLCRASFVSFNHPNHPHRRLSHARDCEMQLYRQHGQPTTQVQGLVSNANGNGRTCTSEQFASIKSDVQKYPGGQSEANIFMATNAGFAASTANSIIGSVSSSGTSQCGDIIDLIHMIMLIEKEIQLNYNIVQWQ